jgi:hypothetical protein
LLRKAGESKLGATEGSSFKFLISWALEAAPSSRSRPAWKQPPDAVLGIANVCYAGRFLRTSGSIPTYVFDGQPISGRNKDILGAVGLAQFRERTGANVEKMDWISGQMVQICRGAILNLDNLIRGVLYSFWLNWSIVENQFR